jgi:hypothetical protein
VSKAIYKYPVSRLIEGLQMPELCDFLFVEMQKGEAMAWFLVLPGGGVIRTFKVYGTGYDIPLAHTYLGSWQDGPFVWHLFEAPPPKQESES